MNLDEISSVLERELKRLGKQSPHQLNARFKLSTAEGSQSAAQKVDALNALKRFFEDLLEAEFGTQYQVTVATLTKESPVYDIRITLTRRSMSASLEFTVAASLLEWVRAPRSEVNLKRRQAQLSSAQSYAVALLATVRSDTTTQEVLSELLDQVLATDLYGILVDSKALKKAHKAGFYQDAIERTAEDLRPLP